MVAAQVLQEGGRQSETGQVASSKAGDPEKAMSAAVTAAASAEKRLRQVEKAKAQQAKDLEAKERELLDTMEDLERTRSTERSHEAALESAIGYERTEVLKLGRVIFKGAYQKWLGIPYLSYMKYLHRCQMSLFFPILDLKVRILQVTLVVVSLAFALWAYSRWLPAPVKLTEEKAIDQSPLSRLIDVEVQADVPGPGRD